MKLILTTFLFLATGLVTSLAADVQSRIVGGTNASNGAYPWMASIGSPSGGANNIFQNQFCGGSLISEDFVVTAAHCVIDDNGDVMDRSLIEVVVGVTNLSNVPASAQRREVVAIHVHPSYRLSSNGFEFNDIALLELSAPITTIEPIPFATSPSNTAGISVRALGWGDTTDSEFTTAFPNILQQVDLNTTNLTQVRNQFGPTLNLRHVGAFASGRDTCQGDSGGPLFTVNPLQLIGLTSFGSGCADETAGIYTNVGFYDDFIKSFIDNSPPDLTVRGRSRTIQHNDLTPVLADGTFIGRNIARSLNSNFVIRNVPGARPLVLNNLTLTNRAHFRVLSSPDSIVGGGTGVIRVRFTNQNRRARVQNSILRFESNDNSIPAFRIRLRAQTR